MPTGQNAYGYYGTLTENPMLEVEPPVSVAIRQPEVAETALTLKNLHRQYRQYIGNYYSQTENRRLLQAYHLP